MHIEVSISSIVATLSAETNIFLPENILTKSNLCYSIQSLFSLYSLILDAKFNLEFLLLDNERIQEFLDAI